MIVLGVTGLIGGGKSTVISVFEALGVPCYDCDKRAKELMNKCLVDEISSLLGSCAYINGRLNRAFVADKIFSNSATKKSLEAIVHPAVRQDMNRWIDGQQGSFVAVESAILIESGLLDRVDKILIVGAPRDLRLARVMARDGCSMSQAQLRMDNQMNEVELARYADFEIITNQNELLVPKVVEIYEKMTNFAQI